MNLSDVITAAILSEELGVASGTAHAILKESGPGTPVGGRVVLYDRRAVREVLIERNQKLLTFLGCQIVTPTPTASEENADA